MIRVGISVEGQTEKEFVKRVLADHLASFGVWPTPVLPARRGGDISIQRLARAMRELLHGFDVVTSLVDFYGFQGKEGRTPDELEAAILDQLNRTLGRPASRGVFPYVQRHEFEALLFSDVECFRGILETSEDDVQRLVTIRGQFPSPEDIDDSPENAPSKRLLKVIPSYRKRLQGPEVAAEIGLGRIRAECPRFNAWLTRLEHLPRTLGRSPDPPPPDP